MRLTSRLLLSILPVVVVVLSVFGGYVAVEREAALVPEVRQQTRAYARAVDIAFEYGLRDVEAERIQAFLNRMSADPRVFGMVVYGADGSVRYRSDSLPAAATAPDSIVRAVLDGTEELAFDQVVDKRRLYTVLRAIRDATAAPPSPAEAARGPVIGVLAVTQPYDALIGDQRRTQLELAVVTLILLATLGVVLAWIMGRIAERPLQGLVTAARALGEGDVDARVPPVTASAELADLAREFNVMAARLASARRELLHETEERLRLERRLAEAEKLATVGTLAAGLAHEIGAPLNVISGRAEMLLRQHDADPEMRRHLESIVAQIGRITRTVRSLLDYARRPARRSGLVSISSVLDGAADLLETELLRTGVTLVRRESYDAWVRGDPDQLQQLFANLLLNAVQAMDGRAEPRVATIRVDAVKGDQSQLGAEVVATVTDTGPGLPEALDGRLFTPFATTKPAGTGLGLVVARSIVQDHGGTLVGTTRGDGVPGAEFTVRLPLAPAPTAEDA